MHIETWIEQDTLAPVAVNRLSGVLFSGDVQANKVGAIITTGGAPSKITDRCIGYFVRNDGYTILIDGKVENNKMFVILPKECYEIAGQFSLVLKSGSTTLAACTGNIYRSRTDEIVDPENIVPSIEELIAKLDLLDNYTNVTEAWAVGQRGGVDVSETDKTYHNNAKYYAEQAAGSVDDAAAQVAEAQEKVTDAEAWAVGQRDGAPVEEEDPTFENNAKYYAEETERNLDEARQRVADAEKAAETARGAVDDAETAVQAAQEAAQEAADTVVAAQGPGILYVGEDGIPYVLE